MPSKKGSIAYENRLARRRMDRRIARLEKEISSGSLTRAQQFEKRGEIAAIQKLRSESYFTTKTGESRAKEVAREAVRSFDREVYRESAQSLANRNAQAVREISSTYYVDPVSKEHIQNPTSSYTEAEMRTFFRVTQRAWENAPAERRIEAIMEVYGADDLRSLIELILNRHQEEVKEWAQEIQTKSQTKDEHEISKQDEAAEFASTDVEVQTQAEIEQVRAEYAEIYGVAEIEESE